MDHTASGNVRVRRCPTSDAPAPPGGPGSVLKFLNVRRQHVVGSELPVPVEDHPLEPRSRAILALNRFGLGTRPGDASIVAVDALAWVLQVADGRGAAPVPGVPSSAERMIHVENLNRERRQQNEADAAARKLLAPGAVLPPPPPPVLRDTGLLFGDDLRARLIQASTSPDPVRERLAGFWSNLMTVSAMRGEVAAVAVPYENEAIRPCLGGRFADMLKVAFRHPAMMLYLDAGQSVGPDSPVGRRNHKSYNENYAREVLELHTVGAESGYTQDDIIQLALALSGWTLDRAAGISVFRPDLHEPGERRILGCVLPDTGPAQAGVALETIAAHPAVSARLCRRLAAHFVSDVPPPALVASMNTAWRTSGGHLATVYRAMFTSPLAWAPKQSKFRDPYDFVVAAARALGTGRTDQSAAALLRHVRALGQPPFGAPSPQGYGDLEADWLSPDSIVQRINVAAAMASEADPDGEVALAMLAEIVDPAPGSHTRDAVMRAPSPAGAAALVLASPEFQRR